MGMQEYSSITGNLIEDLRHIKMSSECSKRTFDKNQRSLDIEKGEIAKFVLMKTPEEEKKTEY